MLFLKKFARQFHKQFTRIDDRPRPASGIPWPGNVRELKNVFERICIMHNDNILGLNHLPSEIEDAPPAPDAFVEIPDELYDLESVLRK